MFINIIFLIVGFALLIKGADYFVDGAASIAGILKIPTIVVGLTIVAFGTSAPEAAVSITAALSNANAIAVSNIIGSNIFNILMVLGITALITKIPVPKSIVSREFLFLSGVSILMTVLIFLDFRISRIEGILFLLLLSGYVGTLIYTSLKNRKNIVAEKAKFSLLISLILIAGGMAAVVIGGNFVVDNAVKIALAIGWSQKLVGLTMVSIGTSLPELVTSISAAKKGHVDIAIGNVVGSNVFNILFILGLSSTITPITVETALGVDLIFMTFATLFTYYLCRSKGQLSKREGLILLMFFVLYLAYILVRN